MKIKLKMSSFLSLSFQVDIDDSVKANCNKTTYTQE